MNIREPIAIALMQLWTNKVRTLLTVLGILIGVGSVVGVVVAESRRRGRVFTAAPSSMGLLLDTDSHRQSRRMNITPANLRDSADSLRNQSSIAKVICLARRRA